MNLIDPTLRGHLTGTMHGAGIPVPLEPRPIRERPHRRGFPWPAPTGPDPDAVARLAASKRKPKRLIEFDVERAAKAYTDGATLAELSASIEAETGRPVSAETIRKRLLGAGVTMRPKASGWGKLAVPQPDSVERMCDNGRGKDERPAASTADRSSHSDSPQRREGLAPSW